MGRIGAYVEAWLGALRNNIPNSKVCPASDSFKTMNGQRNVPFTSTCNYFHPYPPPNCSSVGINR
jgi:hypothetical protein